MKSFPAAISRLQRLASRKALTGNQDILELRNFLKSKTHTAEEVSEILLCLAKLHVGEHSIWNAVLPALQQHSALLSTRCLQKVPLCFARARLRPPILESLVLPIQQQLLLGCFTARDLADLAWSTARLEPLRRSGLLHSIAREAVPLIPEFKPAELSKIAWACATCGVREGLLFTALAKASVDCVDGFTPQGLSNVIWAFATLVLVDLKLQRAVAETATRKMSSAVTAAIFNPQNLANTAWAFARLFCREDALFGQIAQLAEEQMDDFAFQNLSNTLWAFAKVKHDDLTFFEMTSQHVLRQLPEFSIQAAVNSVWAMAEVSYHNHEVFERVAQEASKASNNYKPQDLSNLIWSFAEILHENENLLRSIAKTTRSKVESLRCQHLACVAWSYAHFVDRTHRPSKLMRKPGPEHVRERWTQMGT